jgi:hypothetical protein
MKTIRLSKPIELHIYLPDFYNKISYDGSPEFKDYIPRGVWMSLFEGGVFAGFINLESLNNIMWNAHIMIYKEFRGNNSEEWGKQVANYMRIQHKVKKFLAITPYKTAKRYAENMGFIYLTTLKKSILKNGELMDQYILEME